MYTFLKRSALAFIVSLCVILSTRTVKVFVGHSAAAAQYARKQWATFREGDRLWLVTHGCDNGEYLWFKDTVQGTPLHVRLQNVLVFLRAEGVSLDGVRELVIHSCFNGKWQPYEVDDIRIRPSQSKHQKEVHSINLRFVYLMLD